VIIGECPYCDHPMMTEFKLGAWCEEKCNGCGESSWLKHSNIDPVRYTQKEFNKNFKIIGKEIKRRVI